MISAWRDISRCFRIHRSAAVWRSPQLQTASGTGHGPVDGTCREVSAWVASCFHDISTTVWPVDREKPNLCIHEPRKLPQSTGVLLWNNAVNQDVVPRLFSVVLTHFVPNKVTHPFRSACRCKYVSNVSQCIHVFLSRNASMYFFTTLN